VHHVLAQSDFWRCRSAFGRLRGDCSYSLITPDLCHANSVFLSEKYSLEHAIRNRFARRKEAALDSFQKQVKTGRLKNRDKIHVRIGRILASHPQVADLYEVAVKEANGQLSIEWSAKDGQRQWLEAREGAYLLRTNLTATTASELWAKYMQLTEVEAAFRALKSELSIRPWFHQLGCSRGPPATASIR
jgi:hypothetical protein